MGASVAQINTKFRCKIALRVMQVEMLKVPFDVPTLMAHLNTEDPLALVIRGHLYVESALIKKIEDVLVNKQEFDSARLQFGAKVKLAVALGKVDRTDVGAFTALNRLRSQFAHDVDTKLTGQDELDLYNTLSPRQRVHVDPLRKQGMPFLSRLRLDVLGIILALLTATTVEKAPDSQIKQAQIHV
jgi:hypothetical protein